LPPNIHDFVRKIIETNFRLKNDLHSFIDILEILKQHDFEIEGGVDSDEVFAFIDWVESAEGSEK
jgi:hypothetical protein